MFRALNSIMGISFNSGNRTNYISQISSFLYLSTFLKFTFASSGLNLGDKFRPNSNKNELKCKINEKE